MGDTVLVVRHGPGRGRIEGYCDHVLDWLGAERPALSARIRLHETGTGPAALDDVCAVFFWLADPLLDYPDCYEEAIAIQEEAERRSLPVINRPTVLATYGKDFQAERFLAEDIPTPRTISVSSPSDLAGCVDRLGLPLLVRGGRSFGHEGALILRSRRDVRSLNQDDMPEYAVASALVDTRGRRADLRAFDLWKRYFHRKRILLIGDQCVPDSLYFARTPLVSRDVSLYAESDAWRKRLRPYGWFGRQAYRVMKKSLGVRRAAELETEFTHLAVDHENVFRMAGVALGLQFLAFDYASLPGGEILLWEANPYPFIPSARGNILARARNSQAKVHKVHLAFARCFESLLAAAPHT